MARTNTSRHLSWNQRVIDRALEPTVPYYLPADGISPALDLQRQLGEAALRGFYAPTPSRSRYGGKRLLVVTASAVLSWVVVFGAGSLIVS
jgi:hypothetical protein